MKGAHKRNKRKAEEGKKKYSTGQKKEVKERDI
jgi:hypothetical protein